MNRRISRLPIIGCIFATAALIIPPWTWGQQLFSGGLLFINLLFLWLEIRLVETGR